MIINVRLIMLSILFAMLLTFTNCEKKRDNANNYSRLDMQNWSFSVDSLISVDGKRKLKFDMSLYKDSIVTCKEIDFQKFYSDSNNDFELYLGKRNDTIFCLESDIDFIDIFLILNENIEVQRSWIGQDYMSTIINFNEKNGEKFFKFQMDTLGSYSYDSVVLGNYPKIIFKELYISSSKGFLGFELLDKETNTLYEVSTDSR